MSDVVTAFEELRERLASLPEVASRVASRGANAFSRLARRAYDAGQSVYGVPFTGSKGALDLKESGKLRSEALKYDANGTKIRASVGGVRYARYQLRHGILPRTGALPGEWSAELKTIADDELEKAMRR